MKLLIIGISGVTCGGKTTLANHLKEILPTSKLISQDDYFRDVDSPLHTWIPELNHINFDILTSLDMDKMHQDIQSVVKNKQLLELPSNSRTNHLQTTESLKKRVIELVKKAQIEILIIEGFCIFNYKPLQDLFHLKYYFTLPEEECFRRRNLRVYEPPDCEGYFEKCVWPEHLKQLEEVKRDVKNIKYFDGSANANDSLLEVLTAISIILTSKHNATYDINI